MRVFIEGAGVPTNLNSGLVCCEAETAATCRYPKCREAKARSVRKGCSENGTDSVVCYSSSEFGISG